MRVVLTGASGQLGAYLLDRLLAAGHEVSAWSGSASGTQGSVELRPVDLTEAPNVDRALSEADPDVIVHAAAISAAEAVRRDPEHAHAVNVEATGRLADWCRRHGRRLVFTSTSMVFDGAKSWYREGDPAEPVLGYGRTKLAAEALVLATPRGLVTRMSLLYGPSRSGRAAYFDRTVEALRRGEPQTFFVDEYRTPMDLASAAGALVRLAEREVAGIVHVAGRERMSRFGLIRRVARALGIDPELVHANRQADTPFPEPRPADVSLDTTRLAFLLPDLKRPTIEEAVAAQMGTSPSPPTHVL